MRLPYLCLAVLAGAAWADSGADLIDAVRLQQPERAQQLLGAGADVKAADADGTTALQWAAHHGYTAVAAALLRAGADVRHVNDYGATALSEAAVRGDVALMRALLQAGADPDSANRRGQTALMLVARTNNVAAAQELLRHGANPNAVETTKGQTALMWAAAQRQPEMVRLLLKARARADVVSNIPQHQRQVSGEPRAQHRVSGGFTALLFAARQGCLECVRALVEQGRADIELADPDGITPLNLAVDNFNFDVAAWLLVKGANPNIWDLWGRTPLYLAVDLNSLPRGGRADMVSLDKTTSLRMIELLLQAGADPNLQLKLFPPYRAVGPDRGADQMLTIGATPLLRAAKAADLPAMRLLLGHGARLDLAQNAGITAFMAAAGVGTGGVDTRGTQKTEPQMVEALRLLLAAGARVNDADLQGRTALHGAAQFGFNDVIRMLVAAGANLQAKDARGLTAKDYAEGKGSAGGRGAAPALANAETVKILRQFMDDK
jgi:uncharacterized protein